MRTINIKDKLKEIDHPVESLMLGDFDQIGEHTAKRNRSRDNPLYKSTGCFYRANYERGLLIYSLIKKYKIMSFLEVGWGRGYSSLCAAMAMQENGFGSISTIDKNFDENHTNFLKQMIPQEWFNRIEFIKGDSKEILNNEEMKFRSYEMAYIDGGHDYETTKNDWEYAQTCNPKLVLFDDYKMKDAVSSPHDDQTIDCARLIDEIECEKKELIIMDRRIFFDDREKKDSEIKYGQVLITNV